MVSREKVNDMEKVLYAMLLARRARGCRVSPPWITHIACTLMRQRHPDVANFKGGRDWRRRFLARHRLTWSLANVNQTDDHKVPPNKTDQVQPVDRGMGCTVKRYMAKLLDEAAEVEV